MSSSIDRKSLMEKVYGDKDLLAELIDMFLEISPSMVEAVDQSIKAFDSKKLYEAAHSLKGSIGNFSTAGPFQVAFELETMGRVGDFSDVQNVFAKLKTEMMALNKDPTEIRSEI